MILNEIASTVQRLNFYDCSYKYLLLRLAKSQQAQTAYKFKHSNFAKYFSLGLLNR